MTMQRLDIAGIQRTRESAANDPIYLAGQRMYAIGSLGGGIIAVGDEHLVGKMGGVWAHPFRVLAGWQLAITAGAEQQQLTEAAECIVAWSYLERCWQTEAGLPVRWREWIADDQPVAYVQLSIANPTNVEWRGTLALQAVFDLRPCWFGGGEITPTLLYSTGMLVQATNDDWANGWGAALGAQPHPNNIVLTDTQATLEFMLQLAPNASQTILLALVAEHTTGAEEAATLLPDALRLGAERLAERRANYDQAISAGVTLHTPDCALNEAWLLAKLNLRALEAHYPPALGQYFLAGIPEYPQLFGCDTTYTTVGALATGFRPSMVSALQELAAVAWRQCGRVPHELTTNGRVFNPGNIQETPQFVLAVWDAVCWTGDRELLERMYPLCCEGLTEYMTAGHSWPNTPYFWGDGMVERFGMGIFKVDVQCYAIRALFVLAEMAERLGDTDAAQAHRQRADQLHASFEADWWLPAETMYADSRHSDGRNQFDGHWTVMLPVQLGIASPERAAHVLERVVNQWVNQWGLVHTREREDRVWTLPTGLLALALFKHGRPNEALRLLHCIASTADVGLLGALEELIPQGLCFIQLWSAGLILEGVVSGLLGIHPDALAHTVIVAPQFPTGWDEVRLNGLTIGEHQLDLLAKPSSLHVHHCVGTHPLTVIWHTSTLQHRIEIIAGDTVEMVDKAPSRHP